MFSSCISIICTCRQWFKFSWLLLLLLLLQLQEDCIAQQSYVNNKQLDCDNIKTNSDDVNVTKGFVCNGVNNSCTSYLAFRPNPPYNTPASIGHLLGSQPSLISSINNISTLNTPLPASSIIIVPIICSCSGGRYQHNASYTLKTESDTYFTVANLTYGGLTTCQALMSQNPYGEHNLYMGLSLKVPLMCACPTPNQVAAGFTFLLSFLVTWNDDIDSIASKFRVPTLSVLEANRLKENDPIFPFTPILVPLRTQPTAIESNISPPATPSPLQPLVPGKDSSRSGPSSHKWIFVGVGIGAGLLVALITLVWCFSGRCSQAQRSDRLCDSAPSKPNKLPASTSDDSYSYPSAGINQSSPWSLSSQGIQYALESSMSYKFQNIQKATNYFSDSNRLQGSVYRGSFNGDNAAVKVMKGDVCGEINILRMINHSNVIRLSGFCVHEGNTYLVYEYAEEGSLDNWIHSNSKDNDQMKKSLALSWQQRIQIAYDVADALNYLHNFVNPPYIHKNLNSSNVLLDGNFRAKVANFGLARLVSTNEGIQLTRHVVGTQGYMAPEYIENGVITPMLDVFAFGVVLLELLSGKEATAREKSGQELSEASIDNVLDGDDVREKLQDFIDPSLGQEYPLDLAFSVAHLAKSCVAHDMSSRPSMSEILMTLSKIVSSSSAWDPSDKLDPSKD